MRDWNPRAVWHELRDALKDWIEGRRDNVKDPSLLLHLALTAPLLIGLVALFRRP